MKRFDIFGRKISKSLKYPTTFNMKTFTSSSIDKQIPEKEIPNEIYDLYGVVIH